jgi:hypothetical protein
MPFNVEDQYQQYLYPDAMDFVNNERTGQVPAYNDYSPSPNLEQPRESQRPKLPANAAKVLILNNPSKLNKKLIKFFVTNLDYMNSKGMFFELIVVYEDEMEHYDEQDITEFPMLIDGREQIAGVDSIINNLRSKISNTKNGRIAGGGNGRGGGGGGGNGGGGGDNELRNYFLKELKNDDDDVDDNDMFANTITQRVAAMNKARSASGQHTIRMSNPEIHERTARSASKHNNYGFNDDVGKYDDPLQNAMQTARRKPYTAPTPQRGDNLEYIPPEETPRYDAPSATDIARATSKGSMDDDLMLKYWENQETTD